MAPGVIAFFQQVLKYFPTVLGKARRKRQNKLSELLRVVSETNLNLIGSLTAKEWKNDRDK